MACLLLDVAYWNYLLYFYFYRKLFVDFPYFRQHFIADMTIQWKVNGSLVGAINQIIYGVAFYLMEKISGDEKSSYQNYLCDVFSGNV